MPESDGQVPEGLAQIGLTQDQWDALDEDKRDLLVKNLARVNNPVVTEVIEEGKKFLESFREYHNENGENDPVFEIAQGVATRLTTLACEDIPFLMMFPQAITQLQSLMIVGITGGMAIQKRQQEAAELEAAFGE